MPYDQLDLATVRRYLQALGMMRTSSPQAYHEIMVELTSGLNQIADIVGPVATQDLTKLTPSERLWRLSANRVNLSLPG